jgi:NADH:ubiquinone oxidoreductase subunit 3 (subunit A)
MTERVVDPDLGRVKALAYLLVALFLAKAAACVLFLLPYSSIAGESGLLAWLGQNYEVRVGLLIVTGFALYGTVLILAAASLFGRREPPSQESEQYQAANEATAPKSVIAIAAE